MMASPFAVSSRARAASFSSSTLRIVLADDEQRGRPHLLERFAGEIRPSAARYDGRRVGALGGADERRCGASARAEVSDPKRRRVRLVFEPVRRGEQPPGKQGDIETKLAGHLAVHVQTVNCVPGAVDKGVLDQVVKRDRDVLLAARTVASSSPDGCSG